MHVAVHAPLRQHAAPSAGQLHTSPGASLAKACVRAAMYGVAAALLIASVVQP
jgi:hypothetical protein